MARGRPEARGVVKCWIYFKGTSVEKTFVPRVPDSPPRVPLSFLTDSSNVPEDLNACTGFTSVVGARVPRVPDSPLLSKRVYRIYLCRFGGFTGCTADA